MKRIETLIRRRDFLGAAAIAGPIVLFDGCGGSKMEGQSLERAGFVGGTTEGEGSVPIEGATWFEAPEIGDGIEYRVAPGSLRKSDYMTADLLLDGNTLIVFTLTFHEGDSERNVSFRVGGLNQCSLRMIYPLAMVNLDRQRQERYGAFLKPSVGGDRIDLAKVDRATFTVVRKAPSTARWCMTDVRITATEPQRITEPILPKGPLLDEFGQSTLHEWPAKTRSEDELTSRIRGQLEAAPAQRFPDTFTSWGGWKAKRLAKGTGFFTTHHDGKRWWLVDPDGCAFWSQGPNCVRVDTYAKFDGLETALAWLPEKDGEFADALDTNPDSSQGKMINYLAANMIRAVGPEGWRRKWADIALAELRRLRFNTVANWSEWEWAREAKFPYVRPMSFRPKESKLVYRDFPDVFDPAFERDAAAYAGMLSDTAGDPAFLGYFLMNEPSWGFSSEVPAEGMLFVTPQCHSRQALAEFLSKKYADDAALSAAWKIDTTFDQVAAGEWTARITPEAKADLEAFSVVMSERYFQGISGACRKVAPQHLNLGMRWAGIPPAWAVRGMKSFDVFSMNNYRPTVPREVTDEIHEMLKMPVMIGEFHFGALDVGLPSSGLGHLKNQEDRAKAYRVYMEDAAANPNCVGAHWFTLYDESALGRYDGENYNIGFLDVCNRAYEELSAAGIATHERIYQVADGAVAPYDDAPEHLPRA